MPVFLNARAENEGSNVTVKAGIFAFEGYHIMDENGVLTGYGIEFLELVSKYSHINFELVGYDKSWNDMLAMLEDGQIDVVTSARKTDERQEKFAYSMPIGRNKTVLWVQADNSSLITGDYTSYDGIRIGQLTGSSQNQSLAEFAGQNGFSYVTVEYDSSDAMAAALQSGEIDAILSSDLRKAQNEKTLEIISEDYFYAIVRKDDTKLINEINYAIEQINRNEGDWQNILYYRYYSPVYSDGLTFTAREQEYINAVVSGRKRVTVTASGDRKPYSYEENGQLTGILPDYFKEVMDMAGLPYEVIVPKDEEEYFNLIETHGVDVLLDEISLENTSGRGSSYGLNTDTYMTTNIARIGRQDFTGDIRRIAVADTPGGRLVAQMLKGDYEVAYYPTREAAMRAAAEGDADAAYVYAYSAQLFVDDDTSNSLYYSMSDHIYMDFQMSVLKTSEHELFSILNKCIRQLPANTLNNLILKYTSYPAENINFMRYMRANPGVTLILGVAGAAAAAAILILFLRGRWNKKILGAIEQSNKLLKEQLAIVETLSRDYLNVFAINETRRTIRPIKLEGCEVGGFDKDSMAEKPYDLILEQYIREHVYEDDKQEISRILTLDNISKQIDLHGEFVGNYRIADNGEIHNFQYSYSRMSKAHTGEGAFILAGFRNVDEVVKKEQEQSAVLSKALEEARSANKAKTAFLNNMSHDIRTPMNAIIGFTTVAANHIDDKDMVKDSLKKVLSSGSHLLGLINDILDMSRIESGKLQLNKEPCNLDALLNNIAGIFQSQLKAKNIKLLFDIGGITDIYVMADPLKLNQLFINLISNSIKYTPPGGTVWFSARQKPGVQSGVGEYEFTIKDTGIGMDAEFVKHIFEPFTRDAGAAKSGIEGTGLGMSITKNIVDLMEGSITVESSPGDGTEFKVGLSLELDKSPHAAGEEPDETISIDGDYITDDISSFQGKRVLLVDDNELNREVAAIILEDGGFVVETANDGAQAVKMVEKSAENYYDVILMDVQMPVMNGYDAAKAIRGLQRNDVSKLPVIAMTANAMAEDKEEALKNHMDAHLSKPIDISALIKILKKFVD